MNAILFPTGQNVITVGAQEAMENASIEPDVLLGRHISGDWGDLCQKDSAMNDMAVKNGDRILSSYKLPTGVKVWIITEWDRSITTLLLPSDY